jgi:transcriptional regulator with XRE-family HTH domain
MVTNNSNRERKRYVDMEPGNQFARRLVDACNERGMSLRDLGAKSGVTYEALRKTVKGVSHPTRHVLPLLCNVLGLDIQDMENLLVTDKITKKHGVDVNRILNKDPKVVPFERVIAQLTPTQRSNFLTEMEKTAKANRMKKVKVM